MNILKTIGLFLGTFIITLIATHLIAPLAFAAEDVSAGLASALELVKPLIELYGGKAPFFVKFVAFVGTARLIVKPVVKALQSIVDVTPTVKDDEWLAKVMKSKAYVIVMFVMDYIFSVKLPDPAKIEKAAPAS